ncbi:MAG TPA: DUF302 domain-containing protein [Candidatus Paceibacterota bacterium]|nr:DUF302 domain-containing protein [Candidatus Paceibacterota bacterium]
MQSSLGITKKVPYPFAEAIEKAKTALAEEGFGVLTEIDVAATLKSKLGVAREPYVILGACNPALANEALQAENEVGLLLPCNVVVYENGGVVYVSAVKPSAMLGVIENAALASVARRAEEKLACAVEKL